MCTRLSRSNFLASFFRVPEIYNFLGHYFIFRRHYLSNLRIRIQNRQEHERVRTRGRATIWLAFTELALRLWKFNNAPQGSLTAFVLRFHLHKYLHLCVYLCVSFLIMDLKESRSYLVNQASPLDHSILHEWNSVPSIGSSTVKRLISYLRQLSRDALRLVDKIDF